jgi:hypothetical protein
MPQPRKERRQPPLQIPIPIRHRRLRKSLSQRSTKILSDLLICQSSACDGGSSLGIRWVGFRDSPTEQVICNAEGDLPRLLLPAYTDLSGYEPIEFEEKGKLIIILQILPAYRKAGLYRLLEIRSIDKFVDLGTRCRFSISFGEGFYGYVAQPIIRTGSALRYTRNSFFPSAGFVPFLISSQVEMI